MSQELISDDKLFVSNQNFQSELWALKEKDTLDSFSLLPGKICQTSTNTSRDTYKNH